MSNISTITRRIALGVGAAALAVPAVLAGFSAEASTTPTHQTSSLSSDRTATKTFHAQDGTAQVLSGTTYDWGYRNGWWILRLSGLPVYAGQAVTVSATEVDAYGNEFIGAAPIYCQNVSVTQGRVSARCLFDWGSPIHVRLHYVY